jgi:hypothetical protein
MKTIDLQSFIILVFCITASCAKSPEKREHTYLIHAVEQINVAPNYQWMVILPGMGCHGCIQEGEFFMKKYVGNQDVLFVLTRFSSLKILQQKTGITINEYSNIYVDRDNLFSFPTGNSIYPCIVWLKDGKVVKHMFQSPQNNAFLQMEELLL